MAKNGNPNVTNIPANQHFFESLLEWLSVKFSQDLSTTKIFLPNQRSCREFRELFLQKSTQSKQKKAVILPNIKAISDISFEDFFDFLPNEDAKEAIDEILQIKLISGIDYLFFLSQKIQKLSLFGENLESNQALNIAINLKSLFDEIEKDEIDLDKLAQVDDSDLSMHRQITLDFLKNFHIEIRNSLIKENIFFSSSYHNFIVDKFSFCLEKYGSKSPIIIAGSTGSLSSGKKLIKAISSQKNGHATLHGLDPFSKSYQQEFHPQFLLNELMGFLDLDKKSINKIADTNLQLSCEDRLDFLSALMLPDEEVIKWQNISSHINISNITKDLESNFKLIEAKDELEEAKIIAIILAEQLSEQESLDKKCAVISNNKKLTQLIKYQLQKLSLPFNDSSNLGIFNSKLVNFILLVLELVESDFSSFNLLALIKNPLFQQENRSKNPEQLEAIINSFEIEILRQGRVDVGLKGLNKRLKSLKNEDLSQFLTKIRHNLSKIINLESKTDLSSYVTSLIQVIENLTTRKWNDLLSEESAQIELYEFFENLKLQNHFNIESKNILAIFRTLFSQISYFEKSDALAPIQILSSLEARLINHDLVIISSLNEGDFPEIESENWLGKKIRKDLGVDKKLKKIGQNSYDFCNYLCNPNVVLTRSLNRNNSPSICSPFLLKFDTLCKKIGIKINQGEKYFEYLKLLENSQEQKIKESTRPNPKPEMQIRPKKLAVTDISKMLSDPYSIYAKRILKLRELPKIDFEPSYAEFGNFIHKALEEYIKNPDDFKSNDDFEKYFIQSGFISSQAKLIWWPKFENIFGNFLKQEKELQTQKNYTEIPVKLVIKEILISGKIDRVAIDKDELIAIFDYKTGLVPTAKSVTCGAEPQLTIAALMLIEGSIESSIRNLSKDEIGSINYWKLSTDNKNEIKVICKKNEEIQALVAAAKVGLENLFEYFSDEENGYISAPDLQKYKENEYSHLARVKEWS